MIDQRAVYAFSECLLKKEGSAMLATAAGIGLGGTLAIPIQAALKPVRAGLISLSDAAPQLFRAPPAGKSRAANALDALTSTWRKEILPSAKVDEAKIEAFLSSLKKPMNLAALGGAGGAAVGAIASPEDRLSGAQLGLLIGALGGGTAGMNMAPGTVAESLKKSLLSK